MTRIVLGVAAVLAVALSLALWCISDLSDDNASLQRSVSAYEAQAERDQLAREVHQAHIARLQEQERERADLLNQIEALEGGDAPLSDFMRDASGLLWP